MLRYLLTNLTGPEIARQLYVSPNTVRIRIELSDQDRQNGEIRVVEAALRRAQDDPAAAAAALAPVLDGSTVIPWIWDALAGRVIVDITNPFNPTSTGLAIPADTSIAQEIAKAAPASARVIKAFNTIFGNVLAQGRPLDVFIAGDDAPAKASLVAFVTSLGLRPRDTGDLTMAHWLEGVGLLMIGLGRYGVGNFGFSLSVSLPG